MQCPSSYLRLITITQEGVMPLDMRLKNKFDVFRDGIAQSTI
jgi:hypothetical protein